MLLVVEDAIVASGEDYGAKEATATTISIGQEEEDVCVQVCVQVCGEGSGVGERGKSV